jgi:Flp pilus assembly protein TadG
VHFMRRLNATREESGQILVLFAWWLPLLCLFVGFGIDFGFGFLTKAQLAKACDAAALAAMRNLGQGQTQATIIGKAEFALNANVSSSMYVSAPVPSITYGSSGGEPVVNVTASAQIHTFFIGLAGFHTLTIADSSQATRPPIILSLVLDKSGSMNDNGGSTALPPSVTDFLGYFIGGTDRLGEVSFSDIANSDVAISTSFKTPITNFVNGMSFGGATFAQGGLMNANTEVTGVSNPPANAVQVVVFFTDGWANSIQSTVAGSQVNFGGCAPAEFAVGWCNGVSCWYNANGNSIGGTVVGNSNTAVTCDGQNNFTATDTAPPDSLPNPASLTINNIADEADYRAVQYANTMRAAGITVYAIGLGDKINQTYLQELANDPASSTYNANEPSGLAEFAPTASDLDTAFQTVASKILLRLTN